MTFFLVSFSGTVQSPAPDRTTTIPSPGCLHSRHARYNRCVETPPPPAREYSAIITEPPLFQPPWLVTGHQSVITQRPDMSAPVMLAALLCLVGMTAAASASDLLTLDFEPLLMAASSRSSDDSSDVDSKFLSDLAVVGNVTILSDWQTALTGIYTYIGKAQ